MVHPGSQRYFDDVELGEEFEESQAPSSEQVKQFLGQTRHMGLDGKKDAGIDRFTDTAEARSQGLERAVVPGSMSMAMIMRLVTDWMGPLGRIMELDVSYRRPVLHDDKLRLLGLVTDAETPPHVHLDLALENERGERPLQGTAVVELPTKST